MNEVLESGITTALAQGAALTADMRAPLALIVAILLLPAAAHVFIGIVQSGLNMLKGWMQG